MFEYLSSPMRWCEEKFVYSEYIAEFWNSISSLFFCVVALYGLKQQEHKIGISRIPWYILFFIGLASFWFHFTLSFAGQFADEFGIIILVTYCIKEMYNLNSILYFFITFVLSLISWFFPFASPFIFMISGVSLVLSTYKSIKDENSRMLWNYFIKTGLFSVFLWIFDFVCYINTHCYWHIFVGLTSYLMILYIIKDKYVLRCSNSYVPKLV